MTLEAKKQAHLRFWRGEGPSLILIPAAQMDLYDTDDYRRRFDDPLLMWEAEMRRARPVIDWPTDGIPTVRPNLGVIFAPAIAGQDYQIQPGQMPWPGRPLSRDAIRAVRSRAVDDAPLMQRAAAFFAHHRRNAGAEIAAYHPDTQGIFDIAHLLYGEDIFLDLADDTAWIDDLLDISYNLYARLSLHLKRLLGQPLTSMIHGHGTPQGVYFPHCGVRISEDTPTLLSPTMIARYVMPWIERAAGDYGGVFLHYCGLHKGFFEQACRSQAVKAIDLGNSEMYDTRWLLERCAQSNTVLYSRVATLPDESWPAYTRRLAALVKTTGARCILRPLVSPDDRAQCAEMLDMWHDLTS